MEPIDHARTVADETWKSLRLNGISPTPRNFEVWFAYCGNEKPRLRQRIDGHIKGLEQLTPGIMDGLYRDFFAEPVNLAFIKDNSQALQTIASQLADRIIVDCDMFDECSAALRGLDAVPTMQEIRLAVETLKTATAEASERMQALEQLFTASITRIGELSEKLARSEKEATCDGLTGLANRRMFDSVLFQTAAEACTDGGDLALLMLDIDHFKKFNDAFGHPMGDNVLRLVAQILTKNIKGRDLAARYGGEEFAVILVGAGLASARTIGEQIRALLGQRSLINRSTGQNMGVITGSIGVALYRPGEAAANLIERADQALYRAKREGRNRVEAEAAGLQAAQYVTTSTAQHAQLSD